MSSDTRHLTYEERCQIYALKKSGLSAGAIAVQQKRHRSTIYRELKRNRGGRGVPVQASPGEGSSTAAGGVIDSAQDDGGAVVAGGREAG